MSQRMAYVRTALVGQRMTSLLEEIFEAHGGLDRWRGLSKEEAKASVLTVGSGRGFVIEREHCRYVVTAAHCLPLVDER
jgi:hypothetical protein